MTPCYGSPMTISQLIRALGGPVKIAADIGGISHQAVSLWAAGERIPRDRIGALKKLCKVAKLPVPDEIAKPGKAS